MIFLLQNIFPIISIESIQFQKKISTKMKIYLQFDTVGSSQYSCWRYDRTGADKPAIVVQSSLQKRNLNHQIKSFFSIA